MKLLGVEFRDFACFERQFVPIQSGMNLLVGRNNAGKTALLRGLSALSAVPIGNSLRTVPADLAGYIRCPNVPTFPFELVCKIEDSDSFFFEKMHPDQWARTLAKSISVNNQPALSETTALVRSLFARR